MKVIQNVLTPLLLIIFLSSSLYAGKDIEKVNVDLVASKAHALFPEAKAAYIYKNSTNNFDFRSYENVLITKHFIRIKINDIEAADLADFEIYLYKNDNAKERIKGVKARSYNLDAKGKLETTKMSKKDIFKEEFSDNYNVVKFAVPNVTAGSVFEVEYRVESPFMYSFPTHYFQTDIPVENSEYAITVPEYVTMTPIATGVVELKKSSEDSFVGVGGTTYRLSGSKVPPIEEDKYVLNTDDYRSSIRYELKSIVVPGQKPNYFSQSWSSIGENMLKNSSFSRALTENVKGTKELVAELQPVTDSQEKLKRIKQFITSNIKWNEKGGIYPTQDLDKLIDKGSGSAGDINILLINLLNKVGVETHPCLVKTRSRGLLNHHYPSLSELNYILAAIKDGENYLIADATSTFHPTSHIPLRAQNFNGLLVQKDKSVLLDLANLNVNDFTSFSKLSYDSEKEALTGTKTEMYKDYAGIRKRIRIADQDDDDAQEIIEEEEDEDNTEQEENEDEESDEEDEEEIELEENVYTNTASSGVEEVDKPIKADFDVVLYDVVKNLDDAIYIDAFVDTEFSENPFYEESRKYAVFYNSQHKMKYIYTVSVPEGYTLASLPENIKVNLENNKGSFTYLASEKNSKITIQILLNIKDVVFSAEEYLSLKALYEHILSKQNEKIVLSKS